MQLRARRCSPAGTPPSPSPRRSSPTPAPRPTPPPTTRRSPRRPPATRATRPRRRPTRRPPRPRPSRSARETCSPSWPRLQGIGVRLAERRQAGLEQRAAEEAAAAAAAAKAERERQEQQAAEEREQEPPPSNEPDPDPQPDPQPEPQPEPQPDPSPGPQPDADPAPAPSGGADAAIAFARAQIGEPYVWAAAGPSAWDCSGLTMGAWNAGGKSLPHYSVAQYEQSTPISSGDLRPGDLVFWGSSDSASSIYHVALYVGDGMIMHAPRTGRPVDRGVAVLLDHAELLRPALTRGLPLGSLAPWRRTRQHRRPTPRPTGGYVQPRSTSRRSRPCSTVGTPRSATWCATKLAEHAQVLVDAEEMTDAAFRERVSDVVVEMAATGQTAWASPTEYGGGGDIGASLAAFETLAFGDLSVLVKVGVQFGLFGGAVLQLGTTSHHDRYLADIVSGRLMGCFAMTETGHGSNVQALGTTATYDLTTQEFVLETTRDDACEGLHRQRRRPRRAGRRVRPAGRRRRVGTGCTPSWCRSGSTASRPPASGSRTTAARWASTASTTAGSGSTASGCRARPCSTASPT